VSSLPRQTLALDGSQVSEERRQQKMVSWDLLYFVLRACFDGLKTKYCEVPKAIEGEGEASYEYGRKVVGIRELEEQVEVESEIEGGKREKDFADLVIAADG